MLNISKIIKAKGNTAHTPKLLLEQRCPPPRRRLTVQYEVYASLFQLKGMLSMPSFSSEDPSTNLHPSFGPWRMRKPPNVSTHALNSSEASLTNYRGRAEADTPHTGGRPCLHVSLRDRCQGNICISAERASALWSPAVLKQES